MEKRIILIVFAVFSIAILLSQNNIDKVHAFIYNISVVDTANTNGTWNSFFSDSSGNYMVTLLTTGAVRTFKMNSDTTWSFFKDADITPFATHPVAGGTQTATYNGKMSCSGNICFVRIDGSSRDMIIGVNALSGTVVGRIDSTGTFVIPVRGVTAVSGNQFYYITNTQDLAQVSAPAGFCDAFDFTCSTTWFHLGSSPLHISGAGALGGMDYGIINNAFRTSMPVVATVTETNSASDMIITDVSNNGFSNICTKQVGIIHRDILVIPEGVLLASFTSSLYTRLYNTNQTAGVCENEVYSNTMSCTVTTNVQTTLAYNPFRSEGFYACQDTLNVWNVTTGADIMLLNLAVTTTTNYVSYGITTTGAGVINPDEVGVQSGNTLRVFYLNGSPTLPEEDTSEFCQQPQNVNIFICRVGGDGTLGSAGNFLIGNATTGTGLLGLSCSIGIVDCTVDDNPQTSGLGLLIFIGSIFVVVGMFYYALGNEAFHMPIFIWIIIIVALSAFFTLTGIIDPIFLILSIIAIIALGAPKVVGLIRGGSTFGGGSTE